MSIRALGRMMQKAQKMKSRIGELRDNLSAMHVEAESGAVKVTASCNKQLVSIDIDYEALPSPPDMEEIKESFLAASNEALKKAEKKLKKEAKKALGELDMLLPGIF